MREDQDRWNARYRRAEFKASFLPHPLAERALVLSLPPGPAIDLASGPSGSALLAAAAARPSVAVDISDVALTLLAARARTRHLAGPLALVHADLETWRPRPLCCALVLCTSYWDVDLFAGAARAVLPGGMLGWEALTIEALRMRPGLPAKWCLRPGEPASLLPPGYRVTYEEDVRTDGPATRRRILARRQPEL
ncbi:MAG: hypothetical protein ACTHJW_22545 [Streptosporangiaceae bacterium]